MSKEIINFYEKLNIKGSALPKTWKKHHIFNNCMILCLGGTGTGKTNSLLNYINRSSGEFSEVTVCSFSPTDEPLYNLLEEHGVTLYNNIDKVPDLEEYDDEDKKKPKLIVFDDYKCRKQKITKIYIII